MRHINIFFKEKDFKNKPWLIIGKGPSFNELEKINIADYYSFGLNHVITKLDSLDVLNIIDFDVFEACQDDIYKKAKFLFMPINPHFKNSPTKITLCDLIKKNEILKKLSDEKRLFWYNHLSCCKLLNIKNFFRIFYKKIKVCNFSAEAPFQILGMHGIKEIYSAGVDGGNNYNENFSPSELLANGRDSFDSQFDGIINSIKKFDLIYSPLNSQYPVKVYVGSQEEQMLSVKVLEYSIKKRTKVPVEVFPMHKSNIQYGIPKDPANRQKTPFSFQRFTIPELNEFKGRAIYVDSDMQVMKDIRQLWNLPMGSHDLLTVEPKKDSKRVLQFSVMLLDCDKLKWSAQDVVDMLDRGELNYHTLMREMKVAKNIGVKIPFGWNSLEWYDEKDTGLIHYTDMPTQPWVSRDNSIGHIWVKDLIAAIDDGFISIEYVKEHVKKGWVRPSLVYQVENKIYDSQRLPIEVIEMDNGFIAPYKQLEHIKNS